MIKKILNKLFSQKIDDEHLECAIDEDKVDCGHLDDDQDKAYVGTPAPILNPLDEWFAAPYGAPAAITEKQKEYEHIKMIFKMDGGFSIRILMNRLVFIKTCMNATKTKSTTLDLDPIGGSENFQGGSENIQQ